MQLNQKLYITNNHGHDLFKNVRDNVPLIKQIVEITKRLLSVPIHRHLAVIHAKIIVSEHCKSTFAKNLASNLQNYMKRFFKCFNIKLVKLKGVGFYLTKTSYLVTSVTNY